MAGFDGDMPKLYQTEPAGTYHEWKVRGIGMWKKRERGERETDREMEGGLLYMYI